MPGPDLRVSDRLGQLEGHLHLLCRGDGQGRTRIAGQSFRAPLHLGKGYWDGAVLLVNVVNPTAGLFAGDTLRMQVRVEEAGRLLLTTPSASRAHAMPEGRAHLEQHYVVSQGSWLEVLPELLIPQAGCSYEQHTRIEVEPGGELFWMEMMAPGRVARQELFQFKQVRWGLDLFYGGVWAARERSCLRPGEAGVRALQTPFAAAYTASGYLITPRIKAGDACLHELQLLQNDDLWLGLSELAAGGFGLRMLSRDSVALARGVKAVRRILGEVLPELRSTARKVA